MTAVHRALAAAILLLGGAAHAAIPIVETDAVGLSIAGYFRAFTGYMRPDTGDMPDVGIPEELRIPEELGLHTTVVRTELKLSISDIVTLDVHSRFQWQLTSEPLGSSGGVGVGVSAPPARSVDLRSDLIDTPRHQLNHDLDRLAVRLYLGPVDVVVGRQAITWGTATLFPVADVWTTFSPFDLDTSQKRGIDALRVTVGLTDRVELDALVADRGSVEDLSGGVRTVLYLDDLDLWIGAAKIYEEIALMVGVSAEVETVKLRADLMGLYDIDDVEVQLPRVTLGVDWFASGDFMLGFEAHFNGAGAEPGDYFTHASASEELARGEVYLMGQWYAGLLAMYKPHELVNLTLTSMMNLVDPSAMIAWGVAYQLAQDVEVSLGGFHGIGEGLNVNTPDILVDELGAYGQLVYLQLAAFY